MTQEFNCFFFLVLFQSKLDTFAIPWCAVRNSFILLDTSLRVFGRRHTGADPEDENLPTVARMRGDESPMFWRHSLLMKSDTPLGKF